MHFQWSDCLRLSAVHQRQRRPLRNARLQGSRGYLTTDDTDDTDELQRGMLSSVPIRAIRGQSSAPSAEFCRGLQRRCILQPKVGAPAPTLGKRDESGTTSTRLCPCPCVDGVKTKGPQPRCGWECLRMMTSCLATLGLKDGTPLAFVCPAAQLPGQKCMTGSNRLPSNPPASPSSRALILLPLAALLPPVPTASFPMPPSSFSHPAVAPSQSGSRATAPG
jgi:hypothetical protein